MIKHYLSGYHFTLMSILFKNKAKPSMFTLNCQGRLFVLNEPIVMGIINVTPDSFYAGSRVMDVDDVLRQAEKMIQDGAVILDVGGQSTRPGSKLLNADDELKRTLPAIKALQQHFSDAFISIDTFYATVAREAVLAGASFVNDISSGNMDEEMIPTAASLKVPYVCMHMKGVPQNMQENAIYDNVTVEVLDFFIKKTQQLRIAGINDVIIDPGFGFGKTISHNFELLRNLSAFNVLEKPILSGLSRKATIYKTLSTTAEYALNGTTVLNTISLLNGANILRVHDVKEAVECIRLVKAYKEN